MEFNGSARWTTTEQTFFAQGGNSQVYRVSSNEYEGDFALKLYKFENSTGERFNRFLDEIDVVRSLREIAGCVSCLDHGLFDGRPFYVMKYYRGGTLRDKYIGTQTGTLDEKIDDFEKVLNIVERVHAFGLAIRDIKPQNILIDENDAPILSDFGLSMWIDMPDEDRNTPPLGMIGSQGYRPPEWQTRYPHPNHQPGDIWSLGRLFWAILAGRNAPNSYETLGGKGTHLNLYVGKEHANFFQSVVTSCTAQNPEDRPDISELISQLTHVKSLASKKSDLNGRAKDKNLSDVLSRFNLQIQNNDSYIDSERAESEINIKISELNNCKNIILEALQVYAKDFTEKIPANLGTFRASSPFKGTAFLNTSNVAIKTSNNEAWGMIVTLRYDPSESMKIHKSLSYANLSFYIGMTVDRKFYWIVQFYDHTTGKYDTYEQIETKALEILVSQKISQLSEFVSDGFLHHIETHFKS